MEILYSFILYTVYIIYIFNFNVVQNNIETVIIFSLAIVLHSNYLIYWVFIYYLKESQHNETRKSLFKKKMYSKRR